MVMTVRIYCRVSTGAQEQDGTSLETQERSCREYAAQQGWLVSGVLRDTASGFNLDRPALTALRDSVRVGNVDIVLAHALDRLSRKQTHVAILVEECADHGAVLDFVTENFEDTATGQLLRSVQAFAAELEREKIMERTGRGKEARARSGRIPQGTGIGCFGYRYSSASGQRVIEPTQAAVVRRIFDRYLETRSFSAVAAELNADGIPAFAGGRFYPLTIRRILTNSSYVGQFIYRKTRRVASRNASGRKVSQVVERPTDEWLPIDGASPAIVDEVVWNRVQAVIDDPERVKRGAAKRNYELRGRARCARCGAPMVGQTVRGRGKAYAYYRCRHAYDRNTGRTCDARYVRCDSLEPAIWAELERVLTAPELVLSELRAAQKGNGSKEAAEQAGQELDHLKAREARLMRLFTLGELDEELLRSEAAHLAARRGEVEAELARLRSSDGITEIDEEQLGALCEAISQWLHDADERTRAEVLEALQIEVRADATAATLTGALPMPDAACFTSSNDHANVRSVVTCLT